MASKPIALQIRPRGKPIRSLPETLELGPDATSADLYAELAARTKFSVHQLRVTKGSDGSVVANAQDTSVHATGLRDQSTVYVKDLGTQIGWRTVFVIEYFGPILIHPLWLALRPYIYPSATHESSSLQRLLCWLICLHFTKRELETLFVHRFSAATMPFRNVFKNSFHYWALSGALIAAFIYSPSSAAAREANPLLLYPGLVLFALGELGNLQAHLTLMGLRSAGGSERGIPQGPLFNLVTCPNYLTETISWIGVYLISGLSWGVLIFTIVSVAQMAQWAKKKESRYRKEFGDKYKKKRYTMLPGIW
ncbi:Very-long-chain enoyl-CoA reductase [Elasticomyces elasticus]|uniref:3-oxo-5a-steroid 4- dehydrogenase n=1 Tax=Exophiala sideris TaxID=1016849 RepID=A0ABR0JCS9_9EURO|nr:Very-long-chain enoyl-CoA reductase [Elasticomyces elasticus]KAK5030481.1 3-oxo-5a-steroid 4- dehydrogenase [Exophiala sideris]KAK5038535.1 Very-long-chain enoyl-CoA reductase [Exophiala sideris]KAK5060416.1 3-oxo-5a-steroid 4- dehydrogenase [Exophiala sideris]KAK5183328.1 3-oxo-5a-steroid 4- dehydrogenase [Eurotiomycetes sp. CCFEE 6388]